LDAARGSHSEALSGLIDLVSDLVEAYEAQKLGEPSASPAEVLRLLMDSHGLFQTDLAVEMGGQSVVSGVLNGHREINAKQAGKLAERFGVSAALFVAKPAAALAALPVVVVNAVVDPDDRRLKLSLGPTHSTRGGVTISGGRPSIVSHWFKAGGKAESSTRSHKMYFQH
jgi:antitoxin component HigA of HigAB toxin-antitoxin module